MQRRQNLIEDVRAAVYVEFIVVFWPVFTLFLATIQIGMAMAADVAVQHSADRAARSAIVVLPDDPVHNGGSDRDQLNYNETSNPGFIADALGWITELSDSPIADLVVGGDASVSFPSVAFSQGDSRLNAIRLAAYIPMIPFAPRASELFNVRRSVKDAFAGPLPRAVSGIAYNLGALAVTFPPGPGEPAETSGQLNYGPSHDELTARVTYLFHCAIPFVAQMMCKSASQVAQQSEGGFNELNAAMAPGFVTALGAASLISERPACFLLLRRESTLTYQGAWFKYRSEMER